MPHILQINYEFTVSRAEFERGFDRITAEIAKVPGLRWKIWLLNEAESRGGGIYLFEDEQSVRAYLDGPIVAALKSSPVLTELNVQTFSVLEGPPAMTRGPIEKSVAS